MDLDTGAIFLIIINLSNSFLNSGFFWFIKFILAIYSVVLFVDIILLLVVRGLGGDLKDALKGTQMPLQSKDTMQKDWQAIEKRLKTGEVSQFKLAILESDNLVDSVLMDLGFEGANMKERLDKANANQIEQIDNLIEAHKIRNKIIYDSNFVLDKKETNRVMNLYREFLEELEMI